MDERGGGFGAGDYDIPRHQTVEQQLLAVPEILGSNGDAHDAPAGHRAPIETAAHHRPEVPRFVAGRIEAEDIHLPMPFLPVEEPPPPVETGAGVGAEEDPGREADQPRPRRGDLPESGVRRRRR